MMNEGQGVLLRTIYIIYRGNIRLIQDIIDGLKCILFSFDLGKAFNSIEWVYMQEVLAQFIYILYSKSDTSVLQ